MLPMPLATESLAMLAEILTFIDVETLVCNSVTLSLASGASVYDTLYIEAAKMVGCPMITSDSRLVRKMAGRAEADILLQLRQL